MPAMDLNGLGNGRQMPGGQMQTGPRMPRYNPNPNSGRMQAGPYKSPLVEGEPRLDDPLSNLPPWARMLLEALPDLMGLFSSR